MLHTSRGCLISRTTVLRKKVGKPADIAPEWKQAYLPYETAPTAAEIERERQKFSNIYFNRGENRKLYPVKNVPKNMYTYGKEGFTLPIAIFKDQPDPVIGPEWTYPGIYENKIAARHYHNEELSEMQDKKSFPSPWLEGVLDNQIKKELGRIRARMGALKLRELRPMQKERGAGGGNKGGKK